MEQKCNQRQSPHIRRSCWEFEQNSRTHIVFKLLRDPHISPLSIGYCYAHASLLCLHWPQYTPMHCPFFYWQLFYADLLRVFRWPLNWFSPRLGVSIKTSRVKPHLQVKEIFWYLFFWFYQRLDVSFTTPVSLQHLQVMVAFQYSLCWFYQRLDISVNNIRRFNKSAGHGDILQSVKYLSIVNSPRFTFNWSDSAYRVIFIND